MTYMMWLSILLMLAGSILWISSIYNQTTVIKEAKNAGEKLFITGLVIFIIEQGVIPFFKWAAPYCKRSELNE